MTAKCYDKNWKYTPSECTNISLTFRRERKRMAEEAASRDAAQAASEKIPRIGRVVGKK